MEPITSIALLEFFWYSELESANHYDLMFSKELHDERYKLIKALIYSGNG